MDTKKFLIGTLVGGVVNFLLGFVFYVLLFGSYYESQAMAGVMKTDDMNWLFLGLGNLAIGALFTYIFTKCAGISTFAGGLKGGAIVGFLMAVSYNLIGAGTSNAMSTTGYLVDILVYTVMLAITGGIIGLVLGKVK